MSLQVYRKSPISSTWLINIKTAPHAVYNQRNSNRNAFRTVVTWCVDDVDVGVFPHGVRGRRLDCDPALPLQLHGIHDSSDSILTFHLRKKGKIKLKNVVPESLLRSLHVQEWCFVCWASSFTQWRKADMAKSLEFLNYKRVWFCFLQLHLQLKRILLSWGSFLKKVIRNLAQIMLRFEAKNHISLFSVSQSSDSTKRNTHLPLYIYHGDGKGKVSLEMRFSVPQEAEHCSKGGIAF